MPRRRARTRPNNGVSERDIAALRRAIADGYPWLLHTVDPTFRRTGLNTKQNILLAYVTGISSGAAVFLGAEAHPSRETVATIKAELQADVDAAEERYKDVFIGERHKDGFFRYRGLNDPERGEEF